MSQLPFLKTLIDKEIHGLVALRDSLGSEIEKALDLLFHLKGRVVISGMGKSGHIGQKIAATLASTGTPSYFVHPAEASHGDLGMITKDDAVIALSNSGNTAELNDIIAYCRRFNIPLIAITSNPQSVLGKQASISLILPKATEACPLELAPTTSTTMTLALGDVIALGLLDRRGFAPEDFKVFHPGGKLGSQLLLVSDLCHQGDHIPLCHKQDDLSHVIWVISSKRLGICGVIDNQNKLLGTITDGDLRRFIQKQGFVPATAQDLMTENPKCITKEEFAASALAIMQEHKITSLFVTQEDKQVFGLIHIHDCLKAGIK